MISIEKIYVKTSAEENKAYLVADIEVPREDIDGWLENIEKIEKRNYKSVYQFDYLNENKFSLWYSVDKEYVEYLCYERSDAFIIGLIYFAMVAGVDISSNVPMTKSLYDKITGVLIPTMCNPKTGYRAINIKCECLSEIERTASFVGTGASGGVDSYTEIQLGTREDMDSEHKLTHLCYFNVGALNFSGYLKPYTLESWNKDTNDEFNKRCSIAKKIADDYNLGLVCVNSNIPDLYQGGHAYSHTYRTCSAVFAMQKMWNRYYFASAGFNNIIEPSLSVTSGCYDGFTLKQFSSERLSFGVNLDDLSRLKKTMLIANNASAQKLLNVCSFETYNCGKCDKCIRTMLALDVLGVLDSFSQAFQYREAYNKKKWKYWGMVRFSDKENDYMYEIKKYIEEHNISYPFGTMFYPLYKTATKIYLKIKPRKRR